MNNQVGWQTKFEQPSWAVLFCHSFLVLSLISRPCYKLELKYIFNLPSKEQFQERNIEEESDCEAKGGYIVVYCRLFILNIYFNNLNTRKKPINKISKESVILI